MIASHFDVSRVFGASFELVRQHPGLDLEHMVI